MIDYTTVVIVTLKLLRTFTAVCFGKNMLLFAVGNVGEGTPAGERESGDALRAGRAQ